MLSIQPVPFRQLTAAQINRWSELLHQNPIYDSPYFQPAFSQLVDSVQEGVEVGIMRQSGEIVGVFPYQRTRLGVGVPVGKRLSDFHGVVSASNVQWTTEQLLKSCKLQSFEFDHLLVSNPSFDDSISEVAGSPFLHMPNGFDDYLQTQFHYSKTLKEVVRKSNKLQKDFGPLLVTFNSDSKKDFEQLIEWKIQQYQRTGAFNPMRFSWVLDLLNKIWNTQTIAFSGMLSTLRIGDTLLGAHFGMRSNQTLHSWFPAYNADFYKYSPGSILLMELARSGSEQGIQKIDLGKGTEEYKLSFGSAQTRVAEGCARQNTFTNQFRKRLQSAKTWLKASPLGTPARKTARLLRPIREWWAFR